MGDMNASKNFLYQNMDKDRQGCPIILFFERKCRGFTVRRLRLLKQTPIRKLIDDTGRRIRGISRSGALLRGQFHRLETRSASRYNIWRRHNQ